MCIILIIIVYAYIAIIINNYNSLYWLFEPIRLPFRRAYNLQQYWHKDGAGEAWSGHRSPRHWPPSGLAPIRGRRRRCTRVRVHTRPQAGTVLQTVARIAHTVRRVNDAQASVGKRPLWRDVRSNRFQIKNFLKKTVVSTLSYAPRVRKTP